MKYKKIDGKDLIQGTTYYLDDRGQDKAIYEGVMQERSIGPGHLFTPIGSTTYITYTFGEYDGKYVGKFSLGNSGNFYEQHNTTT